MSFSRDESDFGLLKGSENLQDVLMSLRMNFGYFNCQLQYLEFILKLISTSGAQYFENEDVDVL